MRLNFSFEAIVCSTIESFEHYFAFSFALESSSSFEIDPTQERSTMVMSQKAAKQIATIEFSLHSI